MASPPRSSAPRRRSVPSWPPPQTAALAGSLKPRRRSTCSVSSITDSATTSSFRGVLNTRAVLQDLEGSEEYEYGRLLPILLDMERESPGELCVRQFLAENCEISVSLMEALPFLRSLELPTYQLSQEFRSSAVFRHFLLVLQELSVSDSTCEQIFRKLSRGGGASIQNCRQNAQQLCIARFEANLPWKEWDEILQAAFEGVGDHADHGDRVSYAQWAIGCRRCVRIVRLIITLRLAGGGSKRLMTVESFTKALVDVAMQVMGPEDVSNGLEDFCKRVLRPLNEVLLRSRSEDLLGVLKLQEKPQVKRLLEDCNAGLQKLFLCYAAEPTARRSYWNSDSVTRFAVDFDFLGEVSNLPLQRMFQDACQNPNSVRADDKLFVEVFPLFLLMLANKTHAGQACPVEQDRVPLLFQRINAIACTSTQAPRFGLAKEPLLPLSKDAQTRRSSLVSMGEESRRQETGLSWLLNSTF
ncbi:unnamed protein product [Cladocopium goreaui]|uniref:Uncharacterized protein n=1 Tax=Cladocopium goreaui TaxID=2562237 RepID=A0A9P1CAC6_9DINO|nr:unnamed protein product [Cladocopium goreaui]